MCYFKTLMTFIIILRFHNHSPWKLNHWFHAVFHIWNTHKIIWQPIISGQVVTFWGKSILLFHFVKLSSPLLQQSKSSEMTHQDTPRKSNEGLFGKISLIELHELYCLFKGQQPNTYELITPYIKQLNPNLLNSLK